MEVVNRASTCFGVAEVKGGIGSREPHSFQGNLQEVYPLQKEIVWNDRVNEVCGIQRDEGFSLKQTIRADWKRLKGKS